MSEIIRSLAASIPKTQQPSIKTLSYLEEIGVATMIEPVHRVGVVAYGSPVPLPGISKAEESFSLAAISTDFVPYGPKVRRLHSVVMFCTSQEGLDVVGHVDFTQDQAEERVSHAAYSVLNRGPLRRDLISDLPGYILEATEAFQDYQEGERNIIQAAMKIQESYRDRKLGALLWGLGCAYMETKGVVAVFLEDDITDGFYQKLGSRTFEVERPAKNTARGIRTSGPLIDKYQWFSTNLAPHQQVLVGKAFGINF